MLGNRRGLRTHVLGQVVDRVLSVQQRPHNPQSGRIGQQLERGCCRSDLISGRVMYLRIHAGSVSRPLALSPAQGHPPSPGQPNVEPGYAGDA